MSAFWRLWGWPLALAVATGSGLVAALVSDGAGDIWSWFALGLPLVVVLGKARPRGRARR
jgi:hypothetical protein